MSAAKPSWDDIQDWAKAAVESARGALETCKPDEVVSLQAQIKVMRGLLAMNDASKPELPTAINYTER